MPKYKVLAIDLDDTLLTNDKTVTDENKKWIKHATENGITVVISTGRGYHNMKHIREELDLNMPMVLVNGGEAWDATVKIINRDIIDQNDLKFISGLTEKYDTDFWAYGINSFIRKPDWKKEMVDEACTQFVIRHENPTILQSIKEEVARRDHNLEVTSSSAINVEFTRKGVSKASALQTVCAHLGLTMQDVMAIGDNYNDIQMIKNVGLGIAMGNAIEELKDIADDITGTIEESGVAQAIKKHLMQNVELTN